MLAAAIAGVDAPQPEPRASQETSASRAPRRLRLWELKDNLHCPLIGTCVPMDELARFARRHRFEGDLLDEYLLHGQAVGWARSRNPVSEDLQRHFERKYADHVARSERIKTADELLGYWKEHFANGEVAGPMWAALTHRVANEETRQVVYADMHMLSHQVAAGLAADARRLASLARRNEELAAALERSRAAAAVAEAETRQLNIDLRTARAPRRPSRAAAADLRERLAAFESGQAIVDMGHRVSALTAANEELRSAAERSRTLPAALRAAEDRNAALARERDTLASERVALERLLLSPEPRDDACEGRCEAPCARYENHGPPRALRRRPCRAALAVPRPGRATRHPSAPPRRRTGRIAVTPAGADQQRRCPALPDRLCVSHAAYYKLKQHCKRTGQPCLLFKGAGVSGFAVASARLAAGRGGSFVVSPSGEAAPAAGTRSAAPPASA